MRMGSFYATTYRVVYCVYKGLDCCFDGIVRPICTKCCEFEGEGGGSAELLGLYKMLHMLGVEGIDTVIRLSLDTCISTEERKVYLGGGRAFWVRLFALPVVLMTI